MTKERRYGRFQIQISFLNTHPELVRAMLRDVIVVRAETLGYADVIEYIGEHPAFTPIKEHELVPYYIAQLSRSTETEGLIFHGWEAAQ